MRLSGKVGHPPKTTLAFSSRKGTTMSNAIARLRTRSEQGATAVEYGLMVALIAIVIIAAVILLGTNLSSMFNQVAGSI